MSVLGSVYISLLSLFLSQIYLVSCSNAPPLGTQTGETSAYNNSWEHGHGPQIKGVNKPRLPRSYYWISDFQLKRGPISVFISTSSNPSYIIYQDPEHDRGMIIRDNNNKTMLIAEDRKRAYCGVPYTYHAWNTTGILSYKIDPRGAESDRWYMRVGGKNDETSYIYHRAATKNKGQVTFPNGTTAANFELRKNPVTNQLDPFSGKTLVHLTINIDVDVEPSYLVGLWTLSKKRKRRCTS